MKKDILKLMIITMSVMLLSGCSISINNDNNVDDKNEVNNGENSAEQAKTLDVNDSLVQELYSNIIANDPISYELIGLIKNNDIVLVETISPKLKNYFGYRQVAISNIKSDMCKNYPDIINPDTNKTIYQCGNESHEVPFDKMSDYDTVLTNYIEEKVLKKSVEDIFGIGSYEKTDYFAIQYSIGYSYDVNTSRYVYGTFPGGGVTPMPTFSLLSAEKTNDSIILVQNVKREQNAYGNISTDELFNINIEYTFKLVDGNYYFYSAQKIS